MQLETKDILVFVFTSKNVHPPPYVKMWLDNKISDKEALDISLEVGDDFLPHFFGDVIYTRKERIVEDTVYFLTGKICYKKS